MFSSDFFWSQVWKIIIGAAICIVGIIIYAVLQFVDMAVMYAHTLIAYWPLRALLLAVSLWFIGQLIYWYRGRVDSEAQEQTDSE